MSPAQRQGLIPLVRDWPVWCNPGHEMSVVWPLTAIGHTD